MVPFERQYQIRLKAMKLLQECNLGLQQAVSIYTILNYNKKFSISHARRNLAGMLGFTLYDHLYDKYLIVTDPSTNNYFERYKFTMAHEIGHIALGHLNEKSSTSLIIKDRRIEREADIFADELIMPTLGVLFQGLNTPVEVKNFFCVSLEAAENKMRHFERNALYLDYMEEIDRQSKSLIERDFFAKIMP